MRKLIFNLSYDQNTQKLNAKASGARNQEFGMTVDATADLTPNAKEWFNKALLQGGSRFDFRNNSKRKDSAKDWLFGIRTVLQAF